ncbi:MAG: argininosuccinate synthase, partial [Candidatus Omnitrophica bacterium]|nr:argininosuccinate synthase [Candidatus Omnitrophota bacterium]
DTSCCIRWLKDKGFTVICFSANLGSEFSPDDLKRRAIKSGAAKIYIRDLRREFAYRYILPALKAGAIYERKYLLSTALARPLIVEHLVDIAEKEKAQFVAHGCTGKGNDQIRFEVGIRILNPKLKIIAPLREWNLNSREEEIEYALKNKLPIKVSKNKLYSIDQNIWGVSIEGGQLEDLNKEPPLNSYYLVKPADKVKKSKVYLEIEFGQGIPFKFNGKRMVLVKMIEEMNKLGSECGIGRTDLVEDRVVGIKSREIYEAPGAWILYTAHREIESLTLDRETLFFKDLVALKYAQLIYQGLWFTDLRKALDAFVESTQKFVSGIVGLTLYKGNIIVSKRESKNSLYNKGMATYREGSQFDRSLADGFIKLWGMPYIRGI